MDKNWFQDLFIDEAKAALSARGNSAVSDEQINAAVDAYLEENPVPSATAKIENNVLVVK